jgi:dUTP pyrophosphatase
MENENEFKFYKYGYDIINTKVHCDMTSQPNIPFYIDLDSAANNFFGLKANSEQSKKNNIFFRGFFDRFGGFNMINQNLLTLEIFIDENNMTKTQSFIFKDVIKFMSEYFKFNVVSDYKIEFNCDDGIDFLEKIYSGASKDCRIEEIFAQYETAVAYNCEKGIYHQGFYIIDYFQITKKFVIPEFNFTHKYNFFFRGFFDRFGFVKSRSVIDNDISCEITLLNLDADEIKVFKDVIDKLYDVYKISFHIESNIQVRFTGVNAFDFLTNIYGRSDPRYRCENNYEAYVQWATFGLGYPEIPRCRIVKAQEDAVIPFKSRASDVGYDLTIIKESKRLGDKTIMYDTGIKVQPNFGYYTKIVPRSSLVKSGYMLSNSMGIIDGSYTGTLRIVLTKVDDSFPDLKLPFTCCQLIIDRAIHYELEVVDSIEITSRGAGGFGSTN